MSNNPFKVAALILAAVVLVLFELTQEHKSTPEPIRSEGYYQMDMAIWQWDGPPTNLIPTHALLTHPLYLRRDSLYDYQIMDITLASQLSNAPIFLRVTFRLQKTNYSTQATNAHWFQSDAIITNFADSKLTY